MTEDAVAGGDLNRLRQLNALSVLRSLREGHSLTLTELARRTGLSRPSTEDVVQDLLAQEWVGEVLPLPGALGRPARRYRFRADAGHVVGIDVGAHKVLALVADLDGQVVASRRIAVRPETPQRERLDVIEEAALGALRAAGLTPPDIWAVSVASTGLVDAKGTVSFSVVPDWTGVDLVGHLGRTFDCPVRAENDCRLAALAERWRGVATDFENIVYVLAGSRTGAGIIVNGQLLRGASGAAGEIGVLPEAGWGRAQEHLRGWDGAAQVFAAARGGDRSAAQAVEAYTRDLALGTAALILTVDPELVVLGGGFSRSSDMLLEPLRAELAKVVINLPQVRVSTLGDEGSALGAVRHSLDLVDRLVFAPSAGLAPPRAPRRA
ncbi:ROK family protein [Dactylosporangium sp. NPDC051541]|uniref:ROK family transcriptional regulator n=1 Tax=Dactylosporangium sp. NPDC051541 TaxID=3363977 RepID=UPI0037A1A5B1